MDKNVEFLTAVFFTTRRAAVGCGMRINET